MLKSIAVVSVATVVALTAAGGVFGASRAFAARETAAAAATATAQVGKSADGHYWADAVIDGRPLHLLVDTGASAVALTEADARTLGLRPETLTYDRTVVTAAGRTRAAPVTLTRVAVGAAEVERVSALVVRRGLPASLLGMSYLGRLSGFAADRDGLTLKR